MDWTNGLEDEPCDSCGVKPSKHMGHGSFSCKNCYDGWWCPKCKYMLSKDHVCPTPEEHRKRHVESAILLMSIDDASDALTLAEELTREEPHDQHFIPTCACCGSQAGDPNDSSRFEHKPDCKWKRFRDMVDPVVGRTLGA